MRVVGGQARGRRLKGAVSPGTRATTERVRAAIFNILGHILGPGQYEGMRVLDLFAGSGSLGVEALSRGAAWADFVERDRRQCAVIEDNLSSTGFASRAQVHRNDVIRALAALPGCYRLVLLDPPYSTGDIDRVLDAVAARKGLVIEEGIVIAGHSRHAELRARYGDLRHTSHRRYGDNVIDFFQMGESGLAGNETGSMTW